MTFDEYQIAARRTQNPALTYEEKRNHALFGLASEVGEIHGLFQKQLQGHEITKEMIMDEIGDLDWFKNELCDSIGVRVDDLQKYNIKKLERRYPDGFSAERSVNREEYRHETD